MNCRMSDMFGDDGTQGTLKESKGTIMQTTASRQMRQCLTQQIHRQDCLLQCWHNGSADALRFHLHWHANYRYVLSNTYVSVHPDSLPHRED